VEPAGTALFLLGTSALLVLAATATRLSNRFGVPSLLFFLMLGWLARFQHAWILPAPNVALCFRLGTAALVLILFDGGLNTSVRAARSVLAPSLSLAVVGTLLTALLAAAAGLLLGLPKPIALLIGAVTSSTDAAAVFAALRSSQSRLRERVGLTLELESGLNDPMAVLLTLGTTEAFLGDGQFSWRVGWMLLEQLAIGSLVGYVAGQAGRRLLSHAHLPVAGLYPVLSVAVAFGAFGLATLLEGSGFLAVYLAAMRLGSGRLPYRASLLRVHDALAWIAQITMFLVLGLSVTSSRLPGQLGRGALLALALGLVARPIAVLISLAPFRYSWRERLFIAATGLRGAVPIVLILFPLLRGLPGAQGLFELVFVIVVCNSVLPGAAVGVLSRRLGLQRELPPPAPAGLEMVSHAEYDGEFVSYFISRASAVEGASVRDLPLPETCLVTLIVRGHDILAPRGDTRILSGDHVYVFTKTADRSLADLLFGYVER
jgi:cell volume regulation protein A